MKSKTIIALALAATSGVSCAQSLDIGGVELRLGQDVSQAVNSLSIYKVGYLDSSQTWYVTSGNPGNYYLLGTLSAKNNKVSFISKAFKIDADSNVSLTYYNASVELHRRGGYECAFTEKKIDQSSANGYTAVIDKRCGKYKLSLILPSKMADGNVTSTSIDISVGGN